MNTQKDFNKVREQLGRRIGTLRRDQGLTQEKLGDMVGLDRTYILSIEHGRRNVGLDNLVKIAIGLGVTLPELFDDIDVSGLLDNK